MTIGSAVQMGMNVHVFNEKGQQTCVIPAGYKPSDGLKGYTSTTINVQRGMSVFTYDEHGKQLFAVFTPNN